MSSTVQLLGDSTIDNVFWLFNQDGSNGEEATAGSVEGQLRQNLSEEYGVINHAYDGFTTEDVLGTRDVPVGAVLSHGGRMYSAYLDLRAGGEQGKVVRPLEQLRDTLPEAGTHYVLISVGGNDFRENLGNPIGLLRNISNVQNRHLQIVDQVKELSTTERKVHPILMFQYRTDARNDHYMIYKLFGAMGVAAFVVNLICVSLILVPTFQAMAGVATFKVSMVVCPLIGIIGLGLSHKALPLSVSKDIILLRKPSMSLFDAVLKRFYQPILKEARESQIPVLDLPNTFNPYADLYESGIEPNANGSALIAEGIAHIVQNHDFDGESQLYAKTGESYEAHPNSKSWSVAYPQP